MRAEEIAQLIADMTPAEKIGQMTQVSMSTVSPAEVAEHSIGSVLSGGQDNPTPNNAAVWVEMVGSYLDAAAGSRLGIPLVYGVDAVHGHSNVGGSTIFPHNIGLGAAADENLVRRIGHATATEMLATRVRWTFAPTVAVAHDIRWGRTYESYGRDPNLVSRLGAALIEGLQGPGPHHRVLACAKHFVGDGGTTYGTVQRPEWLANWDGWGPNWQIDQGDMQIDEEEMRNVHLPPYAAAIAAGVETVMASYSSWNGQKLHSHQWLLGDVLKGELGFGGFVVSDWMAIDQIDQDYDTCVITAVNAGVDMVMVPFDHRRFIDATTRAVVSGAIPIERIDDAVQRILAAKSTLGLFEPGDEMPPLGAVGSPAHRKLAAEAARRSAVLLKNQRSLPLGTEPIDVAGVAANDIGLQCGGWTVAWQGGRGPTTAGVTLLDALRSVLPATVGYDPDGQFGDAQPSRTGIVCIAEEPYAEGPGDRALPTADERDRAVFARMRDRCERLILIIYSGRPLVVPDLIEQADAVVAAWLPGTEATELPALLLGTEPFEGKLPQPWPGSEPDVANVGATHQFPVGHGLTTGRARDHV